MSVEQQEIAQYVCLQAPFTMLIAAHTNTL